MRLTAIFGGEDDRGDRASEVPYWQSETEDARRELVLVREELREAVARAELAEARISNLLDTVAGCAKVLESGLRIDAGVVEGEGLLAGVVR